MRITSKGQVTIPLAIRNRHGYLPDTEVNFVERDGLVVVERAEPSPGDRAQRAVEGLRGSGTRTMSTDELLALTRE